MRKNILVFLLITILCLGFLSGCKNTDKENGLTKSQSTNTELSENKETYLTSTKETEANTNSDGQNEGFGGGILTVQKYRTRFYSIPGTFADLVGRENYYEWVNTVDHSENSEKMLMPQFVQHFGITREQFDKANLEFAKIVRDGLDGRPCLNPKDYANQIDDEIFNGDIIFTFDDEVINKYYLSPDFPYLYAFEYDEAVERGEYSSQTEEWVDIEQLEAEIIAKYGETEQVEDNEETQSTEIADIPEESTVTEQTDAVTTE